MLLTILTDFKSRLFLYEPLYNIIHVQLLLRHFIFYF